MRIIIIFLTVLLCSCNQFDSKEKKRSSVSDTSIFYKDGLSDEYYSYYGIIVNNSDEHNFYCINRDVMLKYIENDIDTIQLKKDLKKAKWVTDIRGRSYDYYAWLNFLDTETENITLDYCDKSRKSMAIPVYLVEFNAITETKLSKIDSCEGLHPLQYITYSRPRINMIYVAPLNTESANKFIDMKDTLNRKAFQKFSRNYF